MPAGTNVRSRTCLQGKSRGDAPRRNRRLLLSAQANPVQHQALALPPGTNRTPKDWKRAEVKTDILARKIRNKRQIGNRPKGLLYGIRNRPPFGTKQPTREIALKPMQKKRALRRALKLLPSLHFLRDRTGTPSCGAPAVGSSQPSAAASKSEPSASGSGVPSSNEPAMRPAFCRSAVSISAAIAGLSRRNCLAFSRPCPRRSEL